MNQISQQYPEPSPEVAALQPEQQQAKVAAAGGQPQKNTGSLLLRVLIQAVVISMFLALYWLLVWESVAGWTELVLLALGLIGGSGVILADEVLLAEQYTEPGDLVRPLSKSIVFLFALVPAGLFVLTSTGSELALGFYFGVTLTLLGEMALYFSQPQLIRERFLWQLQRQLSDQEIKSLVLVLMGIFLSMGVLVFV